MKLLFFSILFAIATTSFAASDLEVIKVTPSIDPDQQLLKLQLSISNHGPASSERPRCRLSIYSGQQIVDSAIYELQPLASNETREESMDWKIAVPAANAIGVELFDGLQPDEYPFNNFVKMPLRFPGQTRTDLEIVDIKFPDEPKLDGKIAEFRILVRNKGPVEVRSAILRINLMQFQQPIASTSKKIARFEPGDEKEIKIILRLPLAGIAVEQVLFEAVCEIQDSAVVESDASNNVFSKPVLLSIRMPDLILRDMRVDSRGNLAFWVVNRGTAPSSPSITALYVNGALVRRFNTPEMAGGKSRRHVYGGTKVPAGTQVAVVADFNADMTESSEENNRLNFTVPSK
jgi:subtilase family serine protease